MLYGTLLKYKKRIDINANSYISRRRSDSLSGFIAGTSAWRNLMKEKSDTDSEDGPCNEGPLRDEIVEAQASDQNAEKVINRVNEHYQKNDEHPAQ